MCLKLCTLTFALHEKQIICVSGLALFWTIPYRKCFLRNSVSSTPFWDIVHPTRAGVAFSRAMWSTFLAICSVVFKVCVDPLSEVFQIFQINITRAAMTTDGTADQVTKCCFVEGQANHNLSVLCNLHFM